MYVPQFTLRSGETYYLFGPYEDVSWTRLAVAWVDNLEYKRDDPFYRIEARLLKLDMFLDLRDRARSRASKPA